VARNDSKAVLSQLTLLESETLKSESGSLVEDYIQVRGHSDTQARVAVFSQYILLRFGVKLDIPSVEQSSILQPDPEDKIKDGSFVPDTFAFAFETASNRQIIQQTAETGQFSVQTAYG
jgi:cell division protein YceG involved in septum cleavage